MNLEPTNLPNPEEIDYRTSIDVANVHGAVLREKREPDEGREPAPVWFTTFLFVMFFWAGAYLFNYSGGFRSDVFDETQVTWGPVKNAASPQAVAPIAAGRRVFTANCVACHQSTGAGVPGQYPPLVDSEVVLSTGGYGANHLVQVVMNGLAGPLTVKGTAYNGSMPPWKDVLTDEQIGNVLTYIRQEWGNKAPAISKDNVASIRAKVGTRSQPWTEHELKATPAANF